MSLIIKIIKSIIFVSCCLIILGCKKHPFDYRNKFLGDYHFSIAISSWDPANGSYDTTYTNDGKIWYGSNQNSILISFSGGESTELTIYEDGTLEANNCTGEFESLRKLKYQCTYQSPAAHSYYGVTGEK